MKRSVFFVLVVFSAVLVGTLLISPASSAGSLNVSLETLATGFNGALDIRHAGDDRLFVAEQDGRVRIVQSNGSILSTPFLNITDRVLSPSDGGGSEQGLLGLVFHPDYASNGYFYVYYTRDSSPSGDGDLVLSRFSVTTDPNIADPNSEQQLLVIDHPTFTNHNGGKLAFGPDGYLYIAVGDGGGGGDPNENAQAKDVLLGKILRIDVDGTEPGAPDTCSLASGLYTVPADNPFADGPGDDCDEIWAWGLRNPWRFAFDPLNGDLFIADVGQNAWEEVNYQPAASPGGENYGWDCYEGNHLYNDGSPGISCGPQSDYVFPVFEYDHSAGGCSVTGGEMYRGLQFPELYGHYLFTDLCSGQFWALKSDGGGGWDVTTLGDLGGFFTSFGRGMDGEIYITDGSKVYHVVEDTLVTPTPISSPTPTATPIGIAAPFGMNLVEVADGFSGPTVISAAEDAELFVAERVGKIWSFDPTTGMTPTLILDITDRVDMTGFQEGLLGLVKDPDFSTSGTFYINYTDNFSNTVVSRYTMTTTLPVGPDSEEVLFTLPQPIDDNNGGGLAFGPDGYLYVALGDGGGSGDPSQLAQNPDDLHGKILRLDVHGGSNPPECGAGTYTVPADNPFAGTDGCDEIWQVGFRNIWGISFDRETDDLWIADVGDQQWEEINFQPAASAGGENYGWSCYEGPVEGPNYDPVACTDSYVFPVYAYDHLDGRSVTGGYVYRGSQFPAMQGFYIFADFVFGKVWSLNPGSGEVFEHFAFFGNWSALGEANDGALYIANYGSGKVFRIEAFDVVWINLPLIQRSP